MSLLKVFSNLNDSMIIALLHALSEYFVQRHLSFTLWTLRTGMCTAGLWLLSVLLREALDAVAGFSLLPWMHVGMVLQEKHLLGGFSSPSLLSLLQRAGNLAGCYLVKMQKPCSEPCFDPEKMREGKQPTNPWRNCLVREMLWGKRVSGGFLAEVTPISFFRLFCNPREHTCRVLSKSEFWNQNIWEDEL